MKDNYYRQVDLLLKVLPEFMKQQNFALKGGTAINMFFHDMPRFSVDIDLTYLPVKNRNASLSEIDLLMEETADAIERMFSFECKIRRTKEKHIHRVDIFNGVTEIKAEVNHILRGHVFPCENKVLCPAAQKTFDKFVSARCISFEDVYAGKMCAALDRQHARDLFDIHVLLKNGLITDNLRKTFVFYLACHNRPISELIGPNLQDIRSTYDDAFVEMNLIPITYEELLQAREELIRYLQKNLTNNERLFLLSIKSGEPEWGLMELEGIDQMPAVQWKLQNIAKLDVKRRMAMSDALKEKLEM